MENLRKQYRSNLIQCLFMVLCLTACKEHTPTKATIARGYIRDEQQKPVEGISVILAANKNQRIPVLGALGAPKNFAETTSNAKGYYQVSYVIPSNYAGTYLDVYPGVLGFTKSNPYKAGKKADNSLIIDQVNEVDWILTR